KNALASDDTPSVAESPPADVLHPESTTSAVRRRFHDAMSLANAAPSLAPSGASTRWDNLGASDLTTAWPAKCRISNRGARESKARSLAAFPMSTAACRYDEAISRASRSAAGSLGRGKALVSKAGFPRAKRRAPADIRGSLSPRCDETVALGVYVTS